jgi:hypothetical protein
VRRQNKQAAIAKASHLVIPQRLFHDANLTVVTLERDLQHNVDALVSDPPFNEEKRRDSVAFWILT